MFPISWIAMDGSTLDLAFAAKRTKTTMIASVGNDRLGGSSVVDFTGLREGHHPV